MPSQQQITRATRSGRTIDSQANPIEIPPPSSSGADQDLPANNNLEGTDNPEEERDNDALDGEALDEQLRDDIAEMMENYQDEEVENRNKTAPQISLISSEDEDSSEGPSSEDSDESSSDSSDSNDSQSSSEESVSSESDSDSSEQEVKSKKSKKKSIKSLDKAINKAIKEREKANIKKKETNVEKKGKDGMNEHGKKAKTKKIKSSSSKKMKVSKENGIRFQSGLPCKSLLPTLQTYWNEAMLKLNKKVPLTVLNPSFVQQDQDESHKNQPSSSSKSSRNRGLNPPSEYAMSFGEWIDGISLLRKYLKETYKFAILAKQLKTHIKHVKNIKESTECWMVALRYDIMFQSQLATHRAKGVPMPDASLYVENYEKRAKERASKTGELSFGNTNPYAKGGRYENRNPITGSWNEGTSTNSKKRRNTTTNNPFPSHNRRAVRPPRAPFTQERHDQPQPQVNARENEVRNQTFNQGVNEASGRGNNRRGRGGISTRGRPRQHQTVHLPLV
ncbi:uncharacterized protein MELLADRAFT_104050 [Melampsora larici-populina 98AG31]|uniref:Uncharacterized protein n=1 Tax=Melampsora larici-populina (strain 98AG31 / pathotype 3-4-7) TaxID=747676 RepID=F4RDE0_MELLP|nr:uncharacterized protein MELLADRAFT_104050 [Melampsora larici-populina 98AG31]EGG09627.1 hypothetical protein MELLADRAFT_104050 [Melampsora larici-populina 98AG31]